MNKMEIEDVYFEKHKIIKSNCRLVKNFSDPSTNSKLKLLCVVRDGAYYLPEFIHYYQKIGVNNFIFICNNTEDKTIEILSEFPNVKILRNDLPYKTYWHHFKRFLFEEYGENSWNLIVDIDEFLDFPFSQKLNLHDLINYCDRNNYSAVVTQMIDLVPKGDYSKATNFIDEHIYYSTINEKIESYRSILNKSNTISNQNINFRLNGWRDFKFNVGEIMLTKHALVKHNNETKYTHDHFVKNAVVADFSMLLKHYKFSADFNNYVKKSVLEKNHYQESKEYAKYETYLEKGNNNLFDEKMVDFSQDVTRINNNIINISTNFITFVLDKIDTDKHYFKLIISKLKQNEKCYNEKITNFLVKNEEQEKQFNEIEKEMNVLNDRFYHINKELNDIKASFTWKILSLLNSFLEKIRFKKLLI